MPVLELAEKEVRTRQLLPDNISIKWIPYDDKCDASYATISAMDGYGMDCGHVLFGPTCDYALGKKFFWYTHIRYLTLSVGCWLFSWRFCRNRNEICTIIIIIIIEQLGGPQQQRIVLFLTPGRQFPDVLLSLCMYSTVLCMREKRIMWRANSMSPRILKLKPSCLSDEKKKSKYFSCRAPRIKDASVTCPRLLERAICPFSINFLPFSTDSFEYLMNKNPNNFASSYNFCIIY